MTYSTKLLERNPIGYWRLGQSTMIDDSGFGHTGTYPTGCFKEVVPGLLIDDEEPGFGECIDTAGDITTSGTVAYGSWLDIDYMSAIILVEPRINDPVLDGWIVGRDNSGDDADLSWRLDVASELFRFIVRVGGANYIATSTTAVETGVEYSLGVSFDGTNARLYVNGALEATTAASGVLAKPTSPLRYAASSAVTLKWRGRLDELSLFDYALTAGDFAELRGEELSPTVDAIIDGEIVTAVATTNDSDAIIYAPAPAYLAILDPNLDRPPTSATVVMSNLEPLAEITFTIDAVEVGSAIADLNGDLAATSVNVDREFLAGDHTLTGTTDTQSASATFNLARSASNFPVNQTEDADPVLIEEALGANGVYKWVLQDLMPGGLGSWVMPINPTSMSNPHVRKSVAAVHSTSVAGRHHVYEGAEPLEWQFAGFSPNLAFSAQLEAYADLPRRIYLIDHRNRAWIVAFAGLDIKPRKRVRDDSGVNQDGLADYTAKVVLYDQTPKAPVSP